MNRPGRDRIVGRVVATEALPASPHQFFFWSATETDVGIGAIVRVDGKNDRVVFAVVVDGKAYSDLSEPMHDVIAAHGDPAAQDGATDRREIRLWTAAVLRQMPEEPLQPGTTLNGIACTSGRREIGTSHGIVCRWRKVDGDTRGDLRRRWFARSRISRC